MSIRSLPFKAAALLVLCLIASGPVDATAAQRVAVPDPSKGPSVSGRVIVPVAGFWDRIEVILEYETGAPVSVTNTDGTGNFAFYNLKPGRYFILIELDGFEKVRERADVENGVLPLKHAIFLNPENAKASTPAGVVNVDLRRRYSKKAVDEYEKAREDLADGDLQKAVQRLTAALKEAPNFFEARSMLGTVYHRLRRYPDAELEYRKAHELDPKAVLPLINLGTLYIENADAERDPAAVEKLHKGAYEALDKAVKLDARSATALFLLGAVCYKTAARGSAG